MKPFWPPAVRPPGVHPGLACPLRALALPQAGVNTMAVKTMEELFVHELSDIYSAEKQLTKALPRLAKAASSEQLSTAFETHLEETRGQIERIDQVVEL